MKRKAVILCTVLTLCVLCVYAVNTISATAESTKVIACSDFQNPSGNEEGADFVKRVLSVMAKNGFDKADGFFCCGDYSIDYNKIDAGLEALKTAVSGTVNKNLVFVQGNHDTEIGTAGMSPSGNNDSDKYGVFVINEDDYMQCNSYQETVKNTAQNLIDYLNEKIAAKYEKPVFVVSHLPLHYSMRTKNDGDAQHANYIFNVLNEAGEKGLNIVYMFGHNHSNGYDDYLGGSSVCLKKGDGILIAQNSQYVFKEETLNFTYMNAGYCGYYSEVNPGCDAALTLVGFDITNKDITIERYSENGAHNLKSAGVRNDFKNEIKYAPNTQIYTATQTVELTKVKSNTPIDNLIERPDIENKACYVKITDINDLRDGGKYLLVNNNLGEIAIMSPESIEISGRIGFKLEITEEFGTDVILAEHKDYEEAEWKFTKTKNGWQLGNSKKAAKLTNTADKKITATLENNGDEFIIGGSGGVYKFRSGEYYLNHHGNGLINGNALNPACFYIYEFHEKAKAATSFIGVIKTDEDVNENAESFQPAEKPGKIKAFLFKAMDSLIPLLNRLRNAAE